MKIEDKAGVCKSGGRHKWNPMEEPYIRGAVVRKNIQRCGNCTRVRVIEYTRNGNHIAGYGDLEATHG